VIDVNAPTGSWIFAGLKKTGLALLESGMAQPLGSVNASDGCR
jgi:hypothetical protein